jgi:hypothetical protein
VFAKDRICERVAMVGTKGADFAKGAAFSSLEAETDWSLDVGFMQCGNLVIKHLEDRQGNLFLAHAH